MTDILFIILTGVLFAIAGTVAVAVAHILLTALQKLLVFIIFAVKEAILYGNSEFDKLLCEILKRLKK